MSSLQSQDVVARSATTTPPPQARAHVPEVAKLIDVSKCIGCKACQVACMEWNDLRDEVGSNIGVYDNPSDLTPQSWTVMRFFEVEPEKDKLEWLIRKDGCMHCDDPGCLTACPSPGAIVQYANGVVDFDQSKCIGCGMCRTGCPFDIPRYDANDHPFKCNFCLDRVGNGLVPACAKACPTNALHFGTRADMVELGHKVVAGLKDRGFPNAALYDSAGVGGAGYVYALPHGDKVEHYGDLPKDPAISSLVHLWKGPLKWIGGAAILGSIAAMFMHLVTAGPKTVEAHGKEE